MRDYVDRLEDQLVLAARTDARRGKGRRIARVVAASPRRYVSLMGIGCAAVVAAVLVLSAGSSPDRALAFPVLSRPVTDASVIDIAAQLERNGADLTDARAISTPYGTGYVIPTRQGGLCLAAPDPSEGYGETCGTADEVTHRGLVLAIVPPDPSDSTPSTASTAAEFVAVLPSGATAPVVHHANGTTDTLPLDDGMASTLVRDDVTITYEVDGSTQTSRVPAHAPPIGHVITTCDGPHGHYRILGAGPAPSNPCG